MPPRQPRGNRVQRQPQSRHLDATYSDRDDSNHERVADEHLADEHPGDGVDARPVDVLPEDVDDARREVDGRRAADHAYSAR
jgi:hypothetical protein